MIKTFTLKAGAGHGEFSYYLVIKDGNIHKYGQENFREGGDYKPKYGGIHEIINMYLASRNTVDKDKWLVDVCNAIGYDINVAKKAIAAKNRDHGIREISNVIDEINNLQIKLSKLKIKYGYNDN